MTMKAVVEREFPGPFPAREHQAVDLDGRFGKVEMVYAMQGKVIVRWMDTREIEVMRFGVALGRRGTEGSVCHGY
jgi:hypothetical protein